MTRDQKPPEDAGEVSDEEIRRRILSDPEVQARIREIKAESKAGRVTGPGIGPEELVDFLREWG